MDAIEDDGKNNRYNVFVVAKCIVVVVDDDVEGGCY